MMWLFFCSRAGDGHRGVLFGAEMISLPCVLRATTENTENSGLGVPGDFIDSQTTFSLSGREADYQKTGCPGVQFNMSCSDLGEAYSSAIMEIRSLSIYSTTRSSEFGSDGFCGQQNSECLRIVRCKCLFWSGLFLSGCDG